MKTKNEYEIIGKDEMNLVEFPITLMSKKHPDNIKTLEYKDTIKGRNNEFVERKWTVTGSDKFGLPLAQDNDVWIAILVCGKEQGFEERFIHFSRYRLCQIMGLKLGGSKYKRIKDSLNRLVGVTIYAENAFYDIETNSYVDKAFRLIDDFELFEEINRKEDTLPYSYVSLNKEIFKSIMAGYIKNLDIRLYFSLKGYISKRLYRYLDKKGYKKRKFEINIFRLAYSHVGLNPDTYNYASRIKEKLYPAHKELMNIGFLKSATYVPTADGLSEKVVYVFADRKESIKKAKEPLQLGDGMQGDGGSIEGKDSGDRDTGTCNNDAGKKGDDLLKVLVESGITETVARWLVRHFSAGRIKEQMEVLPFRKPKDPAALLIRSIQEDWAPPAEYKEQIESKKQAKAYRARRDREEREKEERRQKIEKYIGKLSRDDLADLNREARERAMAEGDKIFKKTGLAPHIVKSYVYVLVEDKLGLNV